MRYSRDVRVEKKSGIVILINIYNGLWFRMTQECFQVLELFILSGKEMQEFLKNILDDEDREYFRKVFLHLQKLDIIKAEEDICVPQSVGLSITHRCNLSCSHCSYSAGTSVENELKSDEEILEILKKILSINPKLISITGGEPLLRNNFFEISEMLKSQYNGICNLMTNGTLITENNVRRIIEVFDTYDISIDGVDERTCSLVRGHGVFDRVLKSVKLLLNQGVDSKKISLSMVLTTENEKCVGDFEKLNRKFGTNLVIREYSYIGRGKKNRLLEVNAEEMEKMQFNSDKRLLQCMNCGALKSEIYVNCDGEIYPCPMIIDTKYSIGNILKIDDLSCFFKMEKYKNVQGYKNFINSFMPEKIEQCKECKIKYFCISCPVQHVQYCEQDFFETFCRMKKEYHKVVWER